MDKAIESLNQILGVVVQIVFTAIGLWGGMKLTKNKVDFVGMLIVTLTCSLVGMLPAPWGLIFSFLCMFLLLWKFGGAKIFPDCLFVVLVSWGLGISGKFLIQYLAKHVK